MATQINTHIPIFKTVLQKLGISADEFFKLNSVKVVSGWKSRTYKPDKWQHH